MLHAVKLQNAHSHALLRERQRRRTGLPIDRYLRMDAAPIDCRLHSVEEEQAARVSHAPAWPARQKMNGRPSRPPTRRIGEDVE